LCLLFGYKGALGGCLIEIAVETITSGHKRTQLDGDLGIAGNDLLDPKCLAFKLFGSSAFTFRADARTFGEAEGIFGFEVPKRIKRAVLGQGKGGRSTIRQEIAP
jgi:hypothetical protein